MTDARPAPPRLTIFGATGCGLCEQMLYELEELRGELGFELDIIDITADEALERVYRTRIPVLACRDEAICEYFLDPMVLRQALGSGSC